MRVWSSSNFLNLSLGQTSQLKPEKLKLKQYLGQQSARDSDVTSVCFLINKGRPELIFMGQKLSEIVYDEAARDPLRPGFSPDQLVKLR
jgi:hypothetical protein